MLARVLLGLSKPSGEETARWSAASKGEGAAVSIGSFHPAAEASQEIRSSRGKEVVVAEVSPRFDSVEKPKPPVRPLSHRHGRSAVELNDGGRADADKQVVKQGNLAPVSILSSLRLSVQRGDGRLQGIEAPPPIAQSGFD